MGQVVANLVGNAIKFTPRGGRVAVDVKGTPDGARIQVTDTGVGIPPEELPRIFERFFRGTRASEARSSGSGLGLAIVRSIVEMHGGSMTVESRVGKGSTFTVTLPRSPRSSRAADGGRQTNDGGRTTGAPIADAAQPDASNGTLMADSSSTVATGLNPDAAG